MMLILGELRTSRTRAPAAVKTALVERKVVATTAAATAKLRTIDAD